MQVKTCCLGSSAGWGFHKVHAASLWCLSLTAWLSASGASNAGEACINVPTRGGAKACLTVDELVAQMTLAEKIGQMTQANKLSLDQQPEDVTRLALGSMLSGGGESPQPNTPSAWALMTRGYQELALRTRLQIPMLYGIDAVHGHNNVRGATMFPHNIGLGATRDIALLEKIGRITGKEVLATGIHWNFAPAVSVPYDLRWGRTYEGFSEDTDLVTDLSSAYLRGLQARSSNKDDAQVIGTAKHYIGDGGTRWGTSDVAMYKIDQGNTILSESELRRIHLPPYIEAIAEGVPTVMASFSQWNGQKMHAHTYLLTDVLKGELGFDGLVISDWLGVFQLPGSLPEQVAAAVNAGVDMVMAVDRYREFIDTLTNLVEEGTVPAERIDDAVRRIIRVKQRMGLFEHPFGDPSLLTTVRSAEHRQVAREAVQKSLVLLKNQADLLPLSKAHKRVLVVGRAAHDLGLQSGGWSIAWQGHYGNDTMPGTTILQGLRNQAPEGTSIHYVEKLADTAMAAEFAQAHGGGYAPHKKADVGVVVVGERPYAEGFGDDARLELSQEDQQQIANARTLCKKLILILVSGRPLMVTRQMAEVDAFIAAWLPGPEGDGVGDVIWGRAGFSGRLAFTWPSTMESYQGYPVARDRILFNFGDGLSTTANRSLR